MRRIIAFLVALLVFTSAIPADAQKSKPGCTPTMTIKHAQALKSTKDETKDMAALNALAAEISNVNVACNGFTFTGEGDKVFDPFDLPKGKYRMKLHRDTTESFVADIENAGDSYCGGVVNNTHKEDSVLSNGCRAILSVETLGSPGDWTITIEPLK